MLRVSSPIPAACPGGRPVAIVTGGTHGIGRACVDILSKAGWTVVFQGRDERAGRDLESAHRLYVGGDIRDDATVERLVATALEAGGGRISGPVNNAGRAARKPFAEATLSDASSFVNGAVLTVDGGETAGLAPLSRFPFDASPSLGETPQRPGSP